MSFWTYPRVILHINNFNAMSPRTFKHNVKMCLACAPVITGDEGNAEVIISNYLCGTITGNRTGGSRACMDRCHITIIGNLRGRYHEDTLKEVNAFIKHIRNYKKKGRRSMFYVTVEVKHINRER